MCKGKQRINISNFYEANIQDWQAYFNDVFVDRNKKIDPKLMWLKVIEHSTRIAEGIRKRKFFEAVSSIARVFAWTCGFVTSNPDLFDHASLQDLVWYKYPRACSYCASPFTKEIQKVIEDHGGFPCTCRPYIEEITQKTARTSWLATYREELHQPRSLDEWCGMFDAIFYHRLSLMSLDAVCFHFLEEVGEVLTAMRLHADFTFNFPENKYSFKKLKQLFSEYRPFRKIVIDKPVEYEEIISSAKQALKEEVADVTSWLFSLTSKLLSFRTSFSDYEKEARHLIKEIPEEQAFAKLTGYDIVRSPPSEDRILNFSSILYIWYGNGCTHCRNLLKTGKLKCQCSHDIANMFITYTPGVRLKRSKSTP